MCIFNVFSRNLEYLFSIEFSHTSDVTKPGVDASNVSVLFFIFIFSVENLISPNFKSIYKITEFIWAYYFIVVSHRSKSSGNNYVLTGALFPD